MDNTEELRCISLCTGYAGLEMGLKRVWPSMRTVAYVEIEAFTVANLVAKMEQGKLDVAPVWTNLKTFNAEPFRDRVHIITAGYPCQPFSVAGKRQGPDDPRHLWPYIARIVETIRPVWCIFENVSGHLSLGFPDVYRSLRSMGFKVEAGLFSAREVGAPHKRERLFIMANDSRQRWSFQRVRPQNPDRCSKEGKQSNQPALCDNSSRTTRWPARPGQPQYEWEEPRVIMGFGTSRIKSVADTTSSQARQREQIQTNNRQEPSFTGKIGTNWQQRQAQSSMGRAVDGTRNRVDRLRLLGNGVVPQCAEKAIRILGALFE